MQSNTCIVKDKVRAVLLCHNQNCMRWHMSVPVLFMVAWLTIFVCKELIISVSVK